MDLPETVEISTESNRENDSRRPTYAPVALAMGVAMTAWGLLALSLNIVALCFMSFAGVGLTIWALKSWIREIVLEWKSQ